MTATLTRHDLTNRFRTRSSSIGAVDITVIRMPKGAVVVRPSAAVSDPTVHLLLPLDAPLLVRERDGDQYVVGLQSLTWLPEWMTAALFCARPCDVVCVELPVRGRDGQVVPNGAGSNGALPARPVLNGRELNGPLPPHPAADSSLVPSVRAFVQSALAIPANREPLAARLFEDMLRAMVEALVVEARGSGRGPGGIRQPLREQAVAHIAAYRGDHGLSPKSVATSLRVSLRQLQRAFEEAGSTVAGEIRQQRLDAAIVMLGDARCDSLSVAEVAARAGFRNDAELRRALNAGTGTTPSALRGRRQAVRPG